MPGPMAAFIAVGGVFVHAHLRGGGEFGLEWWQGGRMGHKQNCYNDLYAVAAFLARTKSRLLAISLEDLLNVVDQPNIPGTVNEHPNWRQRLPLALDEIASAVDVAALKRATAERRRAAI